MLLIGKFQLFRSKLTDGVEILQEFILHLISPVGLLEKYQQELLHLRIPHGKSRWHENSSDFSPICRKSLNYSEMYFHISMYPIFTLQKDAPIKAQGIYHKHVFSSYCNFRYFFSYILCISNKNWWLTRVHEIEQYNNHNWMEF